MPFSTGLLKQWENFLIKTSLLLWLFLKEM
jgi:hypothetical protein